MNNPKSEQLNQDTVNKIETLIGYLEYYAKKGFNSVDEVVLGCVEEAKDWLTRSQISTDHIADANKMVSTEKEELSEKEELNWQEIQSMIIDWHMKSENSSRREFNFAEISKAISSKFTTKSSKEELSEEELTKIAEEDFKRVIALGRYYDYTDTAKLIKKFTTKPIVPTVEELEVIIRDKILVNSTEWYSFIDETIKESAQAIVDYLTSQGYSGVKVAEKEIILEKLDIIKDAVLGGAKNAIELIEQAKAEIQAISDIETLNGGNK